MTKETGSFCYHCDWHAGHYVKVMLEKMTGRRKFRNALERRAKHQSGKDVLNERVSKKRG